MKSIKDILKITLLITISTIIMFHNSIPVLLIPLFIGLIGQIIIVILLNIISGRKTPPIKWNRKKFKLSCIKDTKIRNI